MTDKNKIRLIGAVTGIANGLFGSGGGIIAVPFLKKTGMETKKAHACSLAVTLPLSAVSILFYFGGNTVPLKSSFMLIPFGLVGALAGTALIKKISPRLLSGIFGILLIAAGIRNLMI